jgi:hypothetical protein
MMGACVDSLQIDASAPVDVVVVPPDGHAWCQSSTDCAYPMPVCDTVKSACYECVTFDDCEAEPGTVCSLGTCVTYDAGETSDGGNSTDAGHARDAGQARDAGRITDAGEDADAGEAVDAG